MNLPRVFGMVGVVAGIAFVLLNAGGLPAPWAAIAMVAGLVLAAGALWQVLRAQSGDDWSGSARAYWLAVAAEVLAIPLGAQLLIRVFDERRLVVLWVVFVVGAHFLPARAFGVGRYAELGVVLMLLAVVSGVFWLAGDKTWIPSAGAVLAGYALLGFAGVHDRGGTPRELKSPRPRRERRA